MLAEVALVADAARDRSTACAVPAAPKPPIANAVPKKAVFANF
jgi:hypothetical protein